MYFVHPTRIITRPSTYEVALKRGKSIENLLDLLENKEILIFVSPQQLTLISSHPKNLKQNVKVRDPLAPFCVSLKLLTTYLKKFGIAEKSYLIFANYLDYGGLLVVDPLSGPIGKYEPFSNVGGMSSKIIKNLSEKMEEKKRWYEERGIEIKLPKINLEEEKKIVKKVRKNVRESIYKFLNHFYQKNQESLKVFVFSARNDIYKLVESALEKIESGLSKKILKYKNFSLGESAISLQNAVSFLNFLNYQINANEKNIVRKKELEKFFPKTSFEFVFPPEFDPYSYSFNPLYNGQSYLNEGEINLSLFSLGKVISDRERIREFLTKLAEFCNLEMEEIPNKLIDFWKNLEKKLYPLELPAYEPIESLALRQIEKIGELKPFTEKIENPVIEKSYRASLSAAPCLIERLNQFFDVKIFTEEEAKRMFIGEMYHDLVLHSPQKPYLNNFIWQIIDLNPIDRNEYTEKEFVGKIEISGRKYYLVYHADAIFKCNNEIVLSDLKYSLPLPEIYKIAHAKQLQVGKMAIESRNLKVAEKGILFYLISPPPSKLRGTISSSPTNRYVFFTENLENMVKSDILEFYESLKFVCQPGSIKENVEKIFKEHEKENCICSKHELSEKKKEELIKKIKARLN